MKNRIIRFAGQQAIDALSWRKPEKLFGRVTYKAVSIFRRMLVAAGDPPVSYRIGENYIVIPLSHNLPLFKRDYPLYSENIGRIAGFCAAKYSDLKVIDIGANVGDTAALVRKYVDAPVLCIEGDRNYFDLLQTNAQSLGEDIEIELSFVYFQNTELCGRLEASSGTARLVIDNEGEKIGARTLSQILTDHPRFAEARLVKIDTDGFDGKIIAAESDWLKRIRPVLFFEYDPYLCELQCFRADEVFDALSDAGYRHLLIYRNTGEFEERIELKDTKATRALCRRYEAAGSQAYADICALTGQDSDLADEIVKAEAKIRQ